MTRYIQRHGALKRWTHGIHMVACIMLVISGLFVFIPSLGESVGPAVVNVIRAGHRVFAVIFIVVPLLSIIIRPSFLGHFLRNTFAKWDADDKKFMVLFLPYLFAPKKIHMPDQHEVKSGQRVADGLLVFFAITIALSGVVLWVGDPLSAVVLQWALLIHDISFYGICVFGFAHGFLGSGVFGPYRGMARVMFGDGKISEDLAMYHWGHWAREELESGENVTED